MDNFFTISAYVITSLSVQLFVIIIFPAMVIGLGLKFFRSFTHDSENNV